MNYSARLPYNVDEREWLDWLADIKANIASSIVARDFNVSLASWSRQLLNYVRLNYPLQVKDRVNLAGLLYDVACSLVVDDAVASLCANVCYELIRKERDIADLQGHLVLNWEPLYVKVDTLFKSKKRSKVSLEKIGNTQPIVRLISVSRHYFSANAAASIVRKIQPLLNHTDLNSCLYFQTMFVHFLPDCAAEFMPLVLNLWPRIMHVGVWDQQFLSLTARLIEYRAENNGETTSLVGADVLRAVFSAAQRLCHISTVLTPSKLEPLPHQLHDTGLTRRLIQFTNLKDPMDSFAAAAVYSLGPDTATMRHLAVFLRSIETFLHPSNRGSWSDSLHSFLRHFCMHLLKRQQPRPSKADRALCGSVKLPESIVASVIELLKPLLFVAMWGKEVHQTEKVHCAFSCLANIDPDAILPDLLEKIYPALTNLTQVHQTISCISLLGHLSYALLRWPNLGDHRINLLELVLPGLDANDANKATRSAVFISRCFMIMPLTIDAVGATEWLYAFLDRALGLLLEASSHPSSNFSGGDFNEEDAMQGKEDRLMPLIQYTLNMVLTQLDLPLYRLATERVVRWIGENTPLTSADLVSRIASSLTNASVTHSEHSFMQLLKLCDQRIRLELDHGAGQNVSGGNHSSSEGALYWYQCVLDSALSSAYASTLVNSASIWLPLLELQVSLLKSRTKVKVVARMFHSIAGRLVDSYPLETQSHNPIGGTKESWLTMDDVKVEWYSPTESSIQALQQMCQTLLPGLLSRLSEASTKAERDFSTNEDTAGSILVYLNGFLRALSFFQCDLVRDEADGMSGAELVSSWFTAHGLQLDDERGVSLKSKRFLKTSAVNFADYSKLCSFRRLIVVSVFNWYSETLQRGTEAFSKEAKVLKSVVRCFDTALNQRGIQRAEFRNIQRFYSFLKPELKFRRSSDSCKLKPRALWILRLQVAHAARLKHNCVSGLVSPSTVLLFKALLELSVSRYSEVRRLAQASVFNTLLSFNTLRYGAVPYLLDRCLSHAELFDKVQPFIGKGYMFLLSDMTLLKPILRNWKWVYLWLQVLEKGHRCEVPLVHDLLRKSFVQALLVAAESKATLSGLYDENILSLFLSELVKELNCPVPEIKGTSFDEGKLYYGKVMLKLAEVADSPELPWRWRSMALGLVDLFVREKEVVPGKVIDALCSCLVSELPLIQRYAQFAFVRVLFIIKTQSTEEQLNCYAEFKSRVSAPSMLGDGFLDDTRIGALGIFPQEFKVYRPNEKIAKVQDVVFPFRHPAYLEALDRLFSKWSDPDYVENLLFMLSMESNSDLDSRGRSRDSASRQATGLSSSNDASAETFGSKNAELFRAVFQTLPQLCFNDLWYKRWSEFALDAQRTSAQERCAAELFAGWIRAMKFLPLNLSQSKLEQFAGALQQVLDQLSPTLLNCWLSSIKYVFSNRDPRRYGPLLRVIVRNPFDDSKAPSFFSQAKWLACSLQLIRSSGSRLPSRITEYLLKIFDESTVESWSSPYQQVRQLLAQIWVELSLSLSGGNWGPMGGKALLLTEHQCEHPSLKGQFIVQILERASELRERELVGNTLRTLLEILDTSFSSYWVNGLLRQYCGQALDLLLRALSRVEDFELTERAKATLRNSSYVPFASYAEFKCNLSFILHLLDKDDAASVLMANWQWKAKVLPVVYSLYFRHLSHTIEHPELSDMFFETCMTLLPDSVIEVRELAKDTLSGYLQCLPIEKVETYVPAFLDSLGKHSHKIPKSDSSAQQVTAKHSAVLALCALVLAFPYELPSWMPNVLEKLASCARNPAPINQSVRKLFSEFKRTHVDTWHKDILLFSDDQKATLLELFAGPNYYA